MPRVIRITGQGKVEAGSRADLAAHPAVTGDETRRSELLAHHTDPDWREVFLLYAGMLPQATDWLQALWRAEGEPPLLTGRCMAEAVHIAPETREVLLASLNAAFISVSESVLLWETGEVLAEVSG